MYTVEIVEDVFLPNDRPVPARMPQQKPINIPHPAINNVNPRPWTNCGKATVNKKLLKSANGFVMLRHVLVVAHSRIENGLKPSGIIQRGDGAIDNPHDI